MRIVEKSGCGSLAGGEIVTLRGRRGLTLGARTAMRPAATPRITLAAAAAFEAGAAIDLRLRSGDEGGQAVDIASIGNHRLRLIRRLRLRLRLRLVLRLRTVIALAMFTRLVIAL